MYNDYKKIALKLLILFIIVYALVGCHRQKKPVENGDNAKISVVTTIFAPYDFVRAIAAGKADVAMLLPPGSESHSFEPTPQDIIKIKNCGVFIHIGGESDSWVSDVLGSMDVSDMKVITLMDCVDVVEEEIVEGMQEEEDEDEKTDENPEYDEHIWTSPRNAKLIVQKILDVLCETDTANADFYRQNAAAYIAELDELDAKFRNVVENAVRKTLVFGDRFPFRYFADAYGLEYFAAFAGCSKETEASAKTVAFLIDKVKNEKIPTVFHIELSNKKMANVISEATGANVRLLHSCHNVTKAEFEAKKTYVSLMTANVEVLKEALQ